LDPEKLIILGENRLQGTVRIDGAKNSALSIMAATLLTPSILILMILIIAKPLMNWLK